MLLALTSSPKTVPKPAWHPMGLHGAQWVTIGAKWSSIGPNIWLYGYILAPFIKRAFKILGTTFKISGTTLPEGVGPKGSAPKIHKTGLQNSRDLLQNFREHPS